jgi:hypothetical protein
VLWHRGASSEAGCCSEADYTIDLEYPVRVALDRAEFEPEQRCGGPYGELVAMQSAEAKHDPEYG